MHTSILHSYMAEMHRKYAELHEGALADYIPELTKVDPDSFGIVLATVDGHLYCIGDAEQCFTIQSISKPFTMGLALEDKGVDYLRSKVNVEPSGEAFNRISLEHKTGRPRNAMINAGAIATVCHVDGDDGEEKFSRILQKYSLLAGRELKIDADVYQSEKSTGHRNRAIAHMLLNAGVIDGDPESVLDAYFKQCSILVTCKDLAIMGATLANRGQNPVTGVQAIDKHYVPKILSVMNTCGMYDGSGAWTYDIGMPAKSGVGGGIIAVLPGKFAIAVFSPRLDEHGNSVRGMKVCESFSEQFGLHMFNSDRLSSFTVVRSNYSIDQVPSKRIRSKRAMSMLAVQGKKVRVYELIGELGFSEAEIILSQIEQVSEETEFVILSLRRITSVDQAATQLLARLALHLHGADKQLLLADAYSHTVFLDALSGILTEAGKAAAVQVFSDIDHATEWCENLYLAGSGMASNIIRTSYLSQQELLAELTSADLDYLCSMGQEISYQKDDYLCRAGDDGSSLYFILSGYVSVMIGLDTERQQRLATLEAGSAFGEFSVVDKRPRSADVVATTDVKCLVVDYAKLETDRSERAKHVRDIILENLAKGLVMRLRKANAEVRALSL